ncbi:MAG: TonB family protein, partial [Deltaproteobacteria bacterium]|nr:TonB family protein [Deltaproteobacteria bacterium]
MKSMPARSVVAKLDTINKSSVFLKGEGDSSGSQAGESSGKGWAGSVSGAAVYQAPVLLSSTIPGYPERARRLGIEGQVVLRFIVDQSGMVEGDIQVV